MKATKEKVSGRRRLFAPANILVIRKTTSYMEMQSRNDQEALRLVEEGHVSVKDVKLTHIESERCAAAVEQALAAAGLNYRSIYRHEVGVDYNDADLVITIGGDGSFIDAAHHIGADVPVLGVKSASTSHGHFCLADEISFASVLQNILHGQIRARKLVRLSLSVNGEELPLRVVNEVLIAELDISGTNRYQVTTNGRSETQKGSAMVIATPAGSTGLCRSLGGIIQPILSRRFQYLPMLPILALGQRLALPGGLVPADQEVRVVSGMAKMLLHVDGRHIKLPFPLGAELVAKVSEDDLLAFVNARCHDVYKKKRQKRC